MSEEVKALRDIGAWMIVFVFAFAVYLGVFIVTGANIVSELRAYNECSASKDFAVCYNTKKP